MSACNLSCYRPTHRTSVVVLVSWSCSGGTSRPLLGSIGLGLGNVGLVIGLGLENTGPGLGNGSLGLHIVVLSCLYVMANHSFRPYTSQLVWIPHCLAVL